METQQILQKLEPLMPKQVQQWRRTLLVAQSEVRSLVERQILVTACKVLGDFRNKLYLSLPPKDIAAGPLHLGNVLYEREKREVGLKLSELMQNLAIFGRSGAGKTNVSFHLLTQLVEKKVYFLFLDWKRTARHLMPQLGKKIKIYTPGRSLAPFPFNPFLVPPGVDRSSYVNQLVDAMADAYTLGDGAISILQRAIHACYAKGFAAPSVSQLVHEIEAMPTSERSSGWKISARRACESLELSQTMAMDGKTQQAFAKTLLYQNTVIELDGLSQNTKKFLIPLLCYWIYCVQLASTTRERLKYVMFLEEAHHVVYRHEHRAKETLMNVLLRQCRELGIGFVLVDQHPHLISSAGIGNCYTTICMNQKDPADISKAAGLLGLEANEKRFLNLLPVGQGIVKLQDRWRQPFLVQFPLVDAKKGAVTDELLHQVQHGKISWAAFRDRTGGYFTSPSRSRQNAMSLEEGAVALLCDVFHHPDDGVDLQYQRLQVSADKGNRWKEQLTQNGLVRSDTVKSGRTRRVMLRLTSEARLLMTPSKGHDPQASFIHEFWKRRVAKQFEAKGYSVALEASRQRGGGKMDISAARASESLAIEIETGKSDVVSNVKRDLLCGVQKVLVVATSDEALQKVEQQLARAGLLILGRVEVVFRDHNC